MDVVELEDGTKIEVKDETEIPPPYSSCSTEPTEDLKEARQEFKLSLFGQVPRKRRIKLRDKEIELSGHTENATMYALARDWIKTKHYRPPPSKLQKSSLPAPSKIWDNFNDKGQYVSPLVPPLFPFDPADIRLRTKADLMTEHMTRWKRVATDWRQQSKQNDQRYMASYNQLHEMAKNLLAYDD